jgi:hypothetical protein
MKEGNCKARHFSLARFAVLFHQKIPTLPDQKGTYVWPFTHRLRCGPLGVGRHRTARSLSFTTSDDRIL